MFQGIKVLFKLTMIFTLFGLRRKHLNVLPPLKQILKARLETGGDQRPLYLLKE